MSSISAGGVGAIQMAQAEKSQQALKDVFRNLASNLGIDKTSDDAARLAIAERFNAEVQGVNQATLNANDGIAVIQIADAGLQQIEEGQYRLQELAIQSANGLLTDQDRQAIQAEAAQIQDQVRTIISDTRDNDISLLASNDKLSLQTGPNEGDQTAIKLNDFTSGLITVDLSTQEGAERAVISLLSNQNQISSARSDLGAAESGLSTSISQLSGLSEALSASGAQIREADIAEQSTKLTSASIRAQAGIAMQAQANLASNRVHQLIQ